MNDVEKPKRKKGSICPQFKKDVSQVCHKCDWYVRVAGKHPQSEEIIDMWGCAMSFLPWLMVENSQMSRATGAAIEDFRNELVEGVVRSVDGAIRGVAASAQNSGLLPSG